MTARIFLYLIAAWLITMLCWPVVALSQWFVMLPSYSSQVTFADGTVIQQSPLTAVSAIWKSDQRGFISTNSGNPVSPEENAVAIGPGDPGTNWAFITATYADGSVLTETNMEVFAGFEMTSTNQSIAWLSTTDLMNWETNMADSPYIDSFSAVPTFWRLAPDVVLTWFENSLPIEGVPVQTNSTMARPPLP